MPPLPPRPTPHQKKNTQKTMVIAPKEGRCPCTMGTPPCLRAPTLLWVIFVGITNALFAITLLVSVCRCAHFCTKSFAGFRSSPRFCSYYWGGLWRPCHSRLLPAPLRSPQHRASGAQVYSVSRQQRPGTRLPD